MRNVGAGGRLVFVNYTLRDLVAAAYDVQDFHISGGPAWSNRDRFDLEARAAAGTPLPRLHLMLRSLLADRFRLTIREGVRQLPLYYLVIAREDGRLGPQLKPSAADCGPTGRGRGPAPAGAGDSTSCRALITPVRVDFAGQAITQLATVLGMGLKATVVDKTGLDGGYDLQLSFSLDGNDPTLPSLATATEEQLGLRLERQRGPVPVIVIERADPPTEN
jgi:uncharacterized protein (TIGR03435 family)